MRRQRERERIGKREREREGDLLELGSRGTDAGGCLGSDPQHHSFKEHHSSLKDCYLEV